MLYKVSVLCKGSVEVVGVVQTSPEKVQALGVVLVQGLNALREAAAPHSLCIPSCCRNTSLTTTERRVHCSDGHH